MAAHHSTGEHAVVMGGSFAGLLTARVLSDHFDRVTLLERDSLPDHPQPRKGAPQSQHTHGLLAGGLRVLNKYFSGFEGEMVAQGAKAGDLLGGSLWHMNGGFHTQFESGLQGLCCSRLLLDSVLLNRLRRLPNVNIRDSLSVEHCLMGADQKKVLGLKVVDRRTGASEQIAADLVVDCTGRGSHTPACLAAWGYEPPNEERVDVDLNYATLICARKPTDFDGNNAVIVARDAPQKQFAVALSIEGERWSVSLGGLLGEKAPGSLSEFRQFARRIASPCVANFLDQVEPLSEIRRYAMPGSLRQRYERLSRFPQGLLVLGDALCSFNPIYGQGMTVAAMEAQALDGILQRGTQKLASRFFCAAARLIDAPWQIAVTTDFEFEETQGKRPLFAKQMNGYLRLVHRAAQADPAVALAFHQVANLLVSPTHLFRPAFVGRVLKHAWQSRRRLAADHGALLESPLSAAERV